MGINRGEIYFVRLDPTLGREMGGDKSRPVMILSINDINRKPLVVTVVPGTSAGTKRTYYRNIVLVAPSKENGLAVDTLFQCHQVRAIDHARFTAGPVGRLSAEDLRRIEGAIRYNLGLVDDGAVASSSPQPAP